MDWVSERAKGEGDGGRQRLRVDPERVLTLVLPLLTIPVTVLLWWRIADHFAGRNLGSALPGPRAVALAALTTRAKLLEAAGQTLQTIGLGLTIGLSIAFVCGLAITRSRLLERALMPYLVASQAVPVVAVAPLLYLLLLDVDLPVTLSSAIKVIVTALTVFFPMLINTVLGLRAVEVEQRELMQLMSATGWQRLRFLELPVALPTLLAGLRVGVTLSVIGAVVGEFIAKGGGLGSLIQAQRMLYNAEQVFAALLVLVTLALGLYGSAALLERLLLARR